MGRPPLHESDRRSVALVARMQRADVRDLDKIAAECKITRSELVRQILRDYLAVAGVDLIP